jgi:integrase
MAIHTLKAAQIARLGDGYHPDCGGLVLRIKDGDARYQFRYTAPTGQRRLMNVTPAVVRGNAPLIQKALDEARTIAAEARAMLARGHDPMAVRDKTRDDAKAKREGEKAQKAAESATLGKVTRAYHADIIEPNRSPLHARHWLDSIENHVPRDLLAKPIADVTAAELLDAMLPIQRKVPETGTRIRQRLDAVFQHAALRGLCVGNPAAAIRKALSEALPTGGRKQKHHVSVPYPEIPSFMQELRKRDALAARALEFAVLTAARTGEVLGAQWGEFSLDAALWVIPGSRMKGGEEHTVYLSPRAVEILRTRKDDGAEQPFALSNMAMLNLLQRRMKVMVKNRETGKLEPATPHGFRSSFSTWGNEAWANAHAATVKKDDAIEAALAHTEADRVRDAYNRATFDTARRQLLRDWAAFCEGRPAAAIAPPLALAA